MDTLAAALARDAMSVPRSVTEAALRLSHRINRTSRSHGSIAASPDEMIDATDLRTRRLRSVESMGPGRTG
ncbi:hypothetical protein GCM10009559_75580 [Pseudonocardia zijingensis]|uniref:Uncharacterized protein n=1 Tax=Pseudonocardia zijingensis TaxID=153376 RepID=A0ABN1NHF2_9PSEU